jgi:CheY-like chemotaxis protein
MRHSQIEIVRSYATDAPEVFGNAGKLQQVFTGLNVKDECLRRGANHFLLKPFMPDDLLKVLKN